MHEKEIEKEILEEHMIIEIQKYKNINFFNNSIITFIIIIVEQTMRRRL